MATCILFYRFKKKLPVSVARTRSTIGWQVSEDFSAMGPEVFSAMGPEVFSAVGPEVFSAIEPEEGSENFSVGPDSQFRKI